MTFFYLWFVLITTNDCHYFWRPHSVSQKGGRVQTNKGVILDGLYLDISYPPRKFCEKTMTLFLTALLCFSDVPCWSKGNEKTNEEVFLHGTILFPIHDQVLKFCMWIRIQQTYIAIFSSRFFLASFPYELHSSIYSKRIKHLFQQAWNHSSRTNQCIFFTWGSSSLSS